MNSISLNFIFLALIIRSCSFKPKLVKIDENWIDFESIVDQFYLQNEFETPWQFNADFFFAFRVQKFRFLFRFEDILGFSRDDFIYYQYQHPQAPLALRFGINWEFTD